MITGVQWEWKYLVNTSHFHHHPYLHLKMMSQNWDYLQEAFSIKCLYIENIWCQWRGVALNELVYYISCFHLYCMCFCPLVLLELLDQYLMGGVEPTREDLDHVFLRFGWVVTAGKPERIASKQTHNNFANFYFVATCGKNDSCFFRSLLHHLGPLFSKHGGRHLNCILS